MDARFHVLSSGHGSPFRFNGLDPNKPTLPPLTWEAALTEAQGFEVYADTIGGRAIIWDCENDTWFDASGQALTRTPELWWTAITASRLADTRELGQMPSTTKAYASPELADLVARFTRLMTEITKVDERIFALAREEGWVPNAWPLSEDG